MEKDLNYYKKLLPEMITVETQITDEGLIARIKEFPHCHTQAENSAELIDMVNDAVFTYLEVPTHVAKQLGIIYLP